jgi:hypothetical protein
MPAIETYYAGGDRYPNAHSYAMSGFSGRGLPGGNKLRRAVLYSVKKTATTTYNNGTPAWVTPNATPQDVHPPMSMSEVVSTLKKPFQFNPPAMKLAIQMSETAPEETELAGGTASGGSIGLAGTSFEMLFERSIEVHAGSGEYGRLGVAKDYLDVIAVLRGDPTLLEASDDKTIREFTHTLTDLVPNGSEVTMSYRCAIAYSPDLVLFGRVTSINLRFLQFNRDLIPTMGYIDMEFEISNASNRSGVLSQMVPTTGSTGGDVGANVAAVTPLKTTTGWGHRPDALLGAR